MKDVVARKAKELNTRMIGDHLPTSVNIAVVRITDNRG